MTTWTRERESPPTVTGRPARQIRRGLPLTIAALTFAALTLEMSTPVDAQNKPTDAAKPAAATTAPATSTKPAAPAGDSKSLGSYSLGMAIGTQLHSMGLTPNSVAMDRVIEGLRDALSGTKTLTDSDGERVNALVESAKSGLVNNNTAAAKKFLAENGKKKGVITTASGLQYREVKAGNGTSPKATDMVTVHYRGTLLDGTEFDSSIKRAEPATFPANGVIQGWQEALVLMKPGAKWELFVPPELAYGNNSPPPIPPGSLLKFDVELISIQAAPK